VFFSANPEHHIVVQRVTPLSHSSFLDAIHDRRDASNDTSVLVYVHGFNMDFAEALKRAAQIVFDFQYRGTPIAFSWPSNGGPFAYGSDREDALWSIRHLERFLLKLKEEIPDRKINIIAHSMGNIALLNALRFIAIQHPDKALFDNIILAAPDFDADLFSKQIAGETEHLADNWVVYVSKHDRALQVSISLNEAPRLGLAPPTVVDGYQIIDASEIAVSSWDISGSHSYFASHRSVITDMVEVLEGLAPTVRSGLREQFSDGGRFWTIRSP
ncbi:MAG: alpha/beta hydrolase, partial [Hyphomicrobiaceae bacterium]